ncbi:Dyp-type peroxidase [Aurantimicrobium minutum]|uniref:Dyp-type peroxidase n=1 Tax=Aurantimicrobium minutum TaxID=708131 RepID=UPI0024766018|nr:Dyp-type peroxidase [Aurantimicrobium minutum]MDH6423706.1 dye decolorizing peroxidase [Aurantimicrobium minutum]
MTHTPAEAQAETEVTRRGFLASAGVVSSYVAAGVAGFAGGAVTASAVSASSLCTQSQLRAQEQAATIPFFGDYQAGIMTPLQAYGTYMAFNLKSSTGIDQARSMMQLLTDDAARLAVGKPTLPDGDPYLATEPARLTSTFGFGPGFFSKLGLAGKMPVGFGELPAFSIDKLQPEYSGGDLVIHVGADNPLTVAHAARQLTRTANTFATPLWSQTGFNRPQYGEPTDQTGRNLFGQVDGTVNPRSAQEFDAQVWASSGPRWFHDGTCLVIRRIQMDFAGWDKLDDTKKEASMGRRLSNGAPLTGTSEFDKPDLEAKNAHGLSVIPAFAHVRRANTGKDTEKFLRRPLNYEDGLLPSGEPNAGLIFAAYMADIQKQFVPVQQRLADLDLLNTWITPIGSAVFALPPGARRGGYIGEGLLG